MIGSTRPKSYVSRNKRSSLNLSRHKREFGSSHEKSDVWPRPQGVRLLLAKSNPVFCHYHKQLSLSPPQRPLCVVERLRRKKRESAQGTMGRRKREERSFPSSCRPPRAFYFSIIAIFIGTPCKSLCRGEGNLVIKDHQNVFEVFSFQL